MAENDESKRPRREPPLPPIPTSDADTYETPAIYLEILQDLDEPATVHSSKPRSKFLKKVLLSFVILALCIVCCVLLAIHLKQARNSKNCATNVLQGNNSTSTDLQKQKLSNLTFETSGKDKECPIGWKILGGRCYYFSDKTVSDWRVARYECLVRGGDLAVPINLDENDLVFGEMRERLFDRVWFGVYRVAAFGGNNGLVFRGNNIQQYGLSPGLSTSLSSISACFWLKIPSSYTKDHTPTVLSYATSSSENEFVVWVTSSLRVAHGYSALAMAPANVGNIADDKPHHVCVTWELSNGEIKMYVDGFNISTTNVPTTNIMAGGTWVIGQDQDTVGGGFQAKDSMKGFLAEVNVWDRILSSHEIAALASSCGPIIKGNVKVHNDFVTHGGVGIFKPECCMS